MNLSFRIGIAGLALFASAHVSAACERNAQGAFEDLQCATDALNEAHKDFEVAFGQLLRKLDIKSIQTLVSVQEAWNRYRTAETSFILHQKGDGSAGRLLVANSSEQATRNRIRELRSWLTPK